MQPAEMHTEPPDERWLRATEVCLAVVGGLYLVLAVGGLTAAIVVPMTDLPQKDAGAWVFVIYGAMMFVVGAAVGALNFVAMVGVRRRTKWGFVLGIVLAIIYLPSGCLPFGAVIGWGLFQERNRRAFGF